MVADRTLAVRMLRKTFYQDQKISQLNPEKSCAGRLYSLLWDIVPLGSDRLLDEIPPKALVTQVWV